MTTVNAVRKFVKQLAARELRPEKVHDVKVEETVDPWGELNLTITIVLKSRKENDITGRQASTMLGRTHDFLQERGDERIPTFRYMTTEDLAALTSEDD